MWENGNEGSALPGCPLLATTWSNSSRYWTPPRSHGRETKSEQPSLASRRPPSGAADWAETGPKEAAPHGEKEQSLANADIVQCKHHGVSRVYCTVHIRSIMGENLGNAKRQKWEKPIRLVCASRPIRRAGSWLASRGLGGPAALRHERHSDVRPAASNDPRGFVLLPASGRRGQRPARRTPERRRGGQLTRRASRSASSRQMRRTCLAPAAIEPLQVRRPIDPSTQRSMDRGSPPNPEPGSTAPTRPASPTCLPRAPRVPAASFPTPSSHHPATPVAPFCRLAVVLH